MTNSRLTDPEVLESRFPVVLEDFHIRRGSGGKGRWKAGDGTLRRIRFLKPMHVAILSGHRAVPNPGDDGRRARRARPQFRPPQRRPDRDFAGLRADGGRGGRGDRDRHADRGRVGEGVVLSRLRERVGGGSGREAWRFRAAPSSGRFAATFSRPREKGRPSAATRSAATTAAPKFCRAARKPRSTAGERGR